MSVFPVYRPLIVHSVSPQRQSICGSCVDCRDIVRTVAQDEDTRGASIFVGHREVRDIYDELYTTADVEGCDTCLMCPKFRKTLMADKRSRLLLWEVHEGYSEEDLQVPRTYVT